MLCPYNPFLILKTPAVFQQFEGIQERVKIKVILIKWFLVAWLTVAKFKLSNANALQNCFFCDFLLNKT